MVLNNVDFLKKLMFYFMMNNKYNSLFYIIIIP